MVRIGGTVRKLLMRIEHKVKIHRDFYCCVLVLLGIVGLQVSLSAQFFPKTKNFTTPTAKAFNKKLSLPKVEDLAEEDIKTSADSYEYVGSNLIARGHVVIHSKSIRISGDSAVINLKNGDAEVKGKVRFKTVNTTSKTVDFQEYRELVSDPNVKVEVRGQTTTPTGRKKLKLKLTTNSSLIEADRVSGNLNTGHFFFRRFVMKGIDLFVSGELAERYVDGSVKIHRAKASTCEYLLDDNSHYAVGAREMILTPREANRGLFNQTGDYGDYSIFAKNTFLYVWNTPVFWFPALYKPRDFSTFGGRFEFGKESDWGWYFKLRKEFEVLEKPATVKGGILLDFYEDRGFGYGASLDILTPESSTEIFAYSIRDREPYTLWEDDFGENPKVDSNDNPISNKEWVAKKSRIFIPKNRYEFRIANLTHFTPRLSFRGQVDLISDYNFLEEYFPARYRRDVQPPSFAALEYQGDSFSVLAQTAFKVNSFDLTMERLPEVRLDIFRQELFSNIYYQSQTTAGYYRMNWREFDLKRWENPNLTPAKLAGYADNPNNSKKILSAYNKEKITRDQAIIGLWMDSPAELGGYLTEAENYEAFRFDTLHAFYYPIRLFDAINLIPRFAARLTAYSRSSKRKVDLDGLNSMIKANTLDKWPDTDLQVTNYDRKGGSRVRFAMELGAELNTKFYRTWQTPKSAFFNIDGLRHVMVPYINYTFIPKPTESYKHLYYFDDVDLITRQNFFRFGLINRLQTRDGSKVREYFSLENYWDFHFHRDFGFNNVGDFTTILSFTPTDNFSLTSTLVLDVGNNNAHDYEVKRGGKEVGRPGLDCDLINYWETTLTYKFSDDWKIQASYTYCDNYYQRPAYSMASTLANPAAMTNFPSYFERNQFASLQLDFPTYIDKRLKGRFRLRYDIDDGLVDNVDLTLRRDFHCWYLEVSAGAEFSRNDINERTWEAYVGFAVGLTAMPGASIGARAGFEAHNYNDDLADKEEKEEREEAEREFWEELFGTSGSSSNSNSTSK